MSDPEMRVDAHTEGVRDPLLERAIAGDEHAFRELTEPHRRELEFHCYRMLGSRHDAEDVLQETLVAAWRGFSRFERRASVRTWLYRIATNRCLNALRDARRHPPPAPEPPFPAPTPTRLSDPGRLEPYPDDQLEWIADAVPGPAARYEMRESVELAFIAALAHLPGRQRAALVLRDVLGFHAGEVAAILGTSEEGVKGALKRARATIDREFGAGLGEPPPAPQSAEERELVARFVDAFLDDNVERVVELLTDDAWLTMPPATLEYQGPALIGAFLAAIARWRHGQPYRGLPARANLQPAVGLYRTDPSTGASPGVGLLVLSLAGTRVSRITWFIGQTHLPPVGLPTSLELDDLGECHDPQPRVRRRSA